MVNNKGFQDLFKIVMEEVDFLGEGPPPVPWEDPFRAGDVHEIASEILNKKARLLPFSYHDAYVLPLKDKIDVVLAQERVDQARGLWNLWDSETLLGAIYDHSDQQVAPQLQQFLAVISNLYRSFLDPEGPDALHTQRAKWLPPLAVFKHKLDIRQGKIAPYMVAADTTATLFGGRVGVVCVPACYRDHPLLWGALAHEVGGHDVLHSDDTILSELRNAIYTRFPSVKRRHGEPLEREDLLALLWGHWIEEAASDVFAVMNLGPSYGAGLALYQAALNQSVRRVLAVNEFLKAGGFNEQEEQGFRKLRLTELIEALRPFTAFEKIATPYRIDDLSLRTWSISPPIDPDRSPDLLDRLLSGNEIGDLDPHPLDILKLHVVRGAIDKLADLDRGKRDKYIEELAQVATTCAGGKKTLQICGCVEAPDESWKLLEYRARDSKGKDTSLELTEMAEAAFRVGQCIAETELTKYQGSVQKYETWDNDDEDTAEAIKKTLAHGGYIDNMGDDAHLLAGSLLAAFEKPNLLMYREINQALAKALMASFARDRFWGRGDTSLVASAESIREENRI